MTFKLEFFAPNFVYNNIYFPRTYFFVSNRCDLSKGGFTVQDRCGPKDCTNCDASRNLDMTAHNDL